MGDCEWQDVPARGLSSSIPSLSVTIKNISKNCQIFLPRGHEEAALSTVEIQSEGLLAHTCGSSWLLTVTLARVTCRRSPTQGLSKKMCFFTAWWPSSEGAHPGRVGMRKARLLFMTQLWMSCGVTYSRSSGWLQRPFSVSRTGKYLMSFGGRFCK